jgi:hypothetical protein
MSRVLDRLDLALDRLESHVLGRRHGPYVPLWERLVAWGLLLACIIIGLAAAP